MPSPFLVQQFFKELKNFNFVRYNFHIIFFFFFFSENYENYFSFLFEWSNIIFSRKLFDYLGYYFFLLSSYENLELSCLCFGLKKKRKLVEEFKIWKNHEVFLIFLFFWMEIIIFRLWIFIILLWLSWFIFSSNKKLRRMRFIEIIKYLVIYFFFLLDIFWMEIVVEITFSKQSLIGHKKYICKKFQLSLYCSSKFLCFKKNCCIYIYRFLSTNWKYEFSIRINLNFPFTSFYLFETDFWQI